MAENPHGYAEVPNLALEAMAKLGGQELCVLLAIGREIWGWKERRDDGKPVRISTATISEHTGIRDKGQISRLTERLVSRNVITKTKVAGRHCEYWVNRNVDAWDLSPTVDSTVNSRVDSTVNSRVDTRVNGSTDSRVNSQPGIPLSMKEREKKEEKRAATTTAFVQSSASPSLSEHGDCGGDPFLPMATGMQSGPDRELFALARRSADVDRYSDGELASLLTEWSQDARFGRELLVDALEIAETSGRIHAWPKWMVKTLQNLREERKNHVISGRSYGL